MYGPVPALDIWYIIYIRVIDGVNMCSSSSPMDDWEAVKDQEALLLECVDAIGAPASWPRWFVGRPNEGPKPGKCHGFAIEMGTLYIWGDP